MTRQSVHAAFWLTVLRMYLGVFWLLHGVNKLIAPGGAAGSTLHATLVRWPMLAPYTNELIPIIAALEVAVGGLLIVGLLTRLAAFGSLLLAVGYFIVKGAFLNYGGYAGAASAIAVASLVTLAVASDFGVDSLRRYARQRRTRRVDAPDATA